MRVVTYHYVRPSVERPPFGYYHLDVGDFRRQLDHLESEYEVLDRSALLRWIEKDHSPPDDAVLLTFDDGLADHYKWVLPELRSRNLFGVFFVPTEPLVSDGVLPVHRVHSLAGQYSSTALHDALFGELERYEFAESDGNAVDDPYADRQTDDALRTFKRVLNFAVPYEYLDDVLTALESKFRSSPRASEYYLSQDELRELHDAGMVIGTHTVSHPDLSRLSSSEQRVQITESTETVTDIVGERPAKLFAYPYGSEQTFTDETKAHLDSLGYDAAFTTVSGLVSENQFRNKRLALPRIDCNEFPHGGATFDLDP
ncbi:polysaccharide deacetylase family protein [Haladaptatus sp. NG-SE-30]